MFNNEAHDLVDKSYDEVYLRTLWLKIQSLSWLEHKKLCTLVQWKW